MRNESKSGRREAKEKNKKFDSQINDDQMVDICLFFAKLPHYFYSPKLTCVPALINAKRQIADKINAAKTTSRRDSFFIINSMCLQQHMP